MGGRRRGAADGCGGKASTPCWVSQHMRWFLFTGKGKWKRRTESRGLEEGRGKRWSGSVMCRPLDRQRRVGLSAGVGRIMRTVPPVNLVRASLLFHSLSLRPQPPWTGRPKRSYTSASLRRQGRSPTPSRLARKRNSPWWRSVTGR